MWHKDSAIQYAKELVEAIGAQIKEEMTDEDAFTKALYEDATGQMSEAVSCQEYYYKWGRHYLPSLMFAHKMQQCNNFKDPGVQFYGGTLFNDLRDIADDIFCQLPPPVPTASGFGMYGGGGGFGGSASSAAPVSMAAYNDPYAGCIDGSCFVQLANGQDRRVSELRKGDEVSTLGGHTASVLCVLRSLCRNSIAALVTLPAPGGGSLRLTPYHPVLVSGSWVFPADLGKPEEVPCEAVYSFVLSGGSALLVGSMPCVAMGHGLEEGAAGHPYFSSRERVLEDLLRFPGFVQGQVDLSPRCVHRDPETGLICRLCPDGMSSAEAV